MKFELGAWLALALLGLARAADPDTPQEREALAARLTRDWDDDDERWRTCPDCDCEHACELPDGSFFCPVCDSEPDYSS